MNPERRNRADAAVPGAVLGYETPQPILLEGSQMNATITYSNPRTDVVINDWPTGNYRTTAHFWIETDTKRGQRAVRTTKHPITGVEASPKKLTYSASVRIVDGDDGRTYIAHLGLYGISIMRGDMKIQQEYIGPDTSRFAELKTLFSYVDDPKRTDALPTGSEP